MTRLTWLLLILAACATTPANDPDDWSFGDDGGDGKADGSSLCAIAAPPASLGLDPFYTKYCSAHGLAIVSSSRAPDAALHQAQRLIDAMLAPHADVLASMIAQNFHFEVLATSEVRTDLPEDRDDPASVNSGGRGVFHSGPVPNAFSAEENILCYERDAQHGESILVHEFAHAIKIAGFQSVDASFQARVQAAFDAAKAAGKYANLYAGTDPEEYWAEGVQDYFNVHQNYDANDINTRDQLAAYDPALYAIVDEKFQSAHLPARCPRPSFTATGWYRVQNVAVGTGTSLDADQLHPTDQVSGEYWHITSNGDGTFRLTNMYQGEGKSLDVANDGIYEPVMRDTGTYSGQRWTISPITTGELRLTSVFQPTLSLAVNNGALASAATADVPEQAWTIRRSQ